MPLFSEILIKQSKNNLKELVSELSEIIESDQYDIMDQYQVINSTSGLMNTVVSGNQNDDYIINYKAINKEIFISLIIPKTQHDKFLITTIYGKYQEGWKLNFLQVGQLTINNKTAPQLYEEALEDNKNGYSVDALNKVYLAQSVLFPGNELFEYLKAKEINTFYEERMKTLNDHYQFPIKLKNIPSEPEIFSISPIVTKQGYFPNVKYLTKFNLDDTVQTKLENKRIHNIIDQKIYGLKENNDYILYEASNEIPRGEKGVPSYRFVKESY